MNFVKKIVSLSLIFLLLNGRSYAAFDVQGVELSRDGNICINPPLGSTNTSVDLTTLQSNSESVQSKISSGGSFCTPVPFFVGGAQAVTSGIKIQAQPTVQSLGRGILISEVAGSLGGVSSSGDPGGFNSLFGRLGGLTRTIFEISLPDGCDVVDDDDDVVGASSDLSTINDFSFPTCASTNGLTVQCNNVSGLLTASNGLTQASSSSPAKIRFVVLATDTIADGNMIDSILIKLDSQDIFCPSTIAGPLTATVVAKNAVDNPTITETIGTADLGTPTQAAKISYTADTATSLKGEVSTNEVGTTAILAGGVITTANKIQIEELNNESIPIGGRSSPLVINPSLSPNNENSQVSIWLVPSATNLFSSPPSSSDILFSDSSFVVSANPYIVRTNADDLNAPIGTLVIPVKKNIASGAADPTKTKTTITINNISLASPNSSDQDGTISLAFFEPTSGAIVNTPAVLSVNDSTNATNPQNFSAFSVNSVRALAQNTVIGGAVNESTAASQITTNLDLSAATSRNTTLGTPQIIGFTKVVTVLVPVDVSKVTVSNSNSLLIVSGDIGAGIPGAKVKIDSAFDSVTIVSKKDGSFNAKLQADFSKGDVTLSFKQTVSNSDSQLTTKIVPQQVAQSSNNGCEKTVCGCDNLGCTPTITSINSFIKNNGGLSQIVLSGGTLLDELINSAKRALGLN